MKEKLLSIITRHVFILFFVFLTACGTTTNEALPQATIPLPKQDDSSDEAIVVSAPNDSGMVAVKGTSQLVSDDTVLLAQVVGEVMESEEINQQADDDEEALDVAKENCSETLPICPELNSDNLCQHEANNDGSFYFTVPATVSDYVKLAYQVTNTCESGDVAEVQVKEEEVKIKKEEVDLPEVETTTKTAEVDALTTETGVGSEKTDTNSIDAKSSDTENSETASTNENDETTVALEEEVVDTNPTPVIETYEEIVERKINAFEFKKVPFVRFINKQLVMLVGIEVEGEDELSYFVIKGAFDFVTGFSLDDYWFVDQTNSRVRARYRVRIRKNGVKKHILIMKVRKDRHNIRIFLNSMRMKDRFY